MLTVKPLFCATYVIFVISYENLFSQFKSSQAVR